MSMHKQWVAAIFGAVAGLMLLVAPARAATTPEKFVQSLSDEAIAVLSDSTLDREARYQAFRTLLLGNTDMNGIAGFALGRYAKDMRAANRYDEYLELFKEYIVRIYAARLGQYSGEKLKVSKAIQKDGDVIVTSRVLSPNSASDPIDVNWRLIPAGDSYKIKDVQIAGLWMAIEQRDQFTSVITNNNRQIQKLIDYLKQQLAQNPPAAGNKPS